MEADSTVEKAEGTTALCIYSGTSDKGHSE